MFLTLRIALIVFVIGFDQWTKYLAKLYLRNQPTQSFLGGLLQLEYRENTGAFLSLGATLSDSARFWIFIVIGFAFMIWALYALIKHKTYEHWTDIALPLIIGGGIGNLIDRMLYDNQGVVDFLYLGVGSIGTGIFNVADMAISGGVLMLLLKNFLVKESVKA